MWQAITKSFDIGDGRTISIETGKLARQADGAVVVGRQLHGYHCAFAHQGSGCGVPGR